jgi:Ca2+-binding EF-hand superfamily protein
MIREIFEEIDADHSGTISEIELETALSKLGIKR